jgi:peptidoglycan/xylan/chitin deacetylase (PgdA/CDA1 family)
MDSSSKVLYLTFDDGPIPECTPQVLDILARYGVKATFFMVADNAVRYPELLERVKAEGHMLGNHTYHHLRGFKVDTSTYLADVAKAEEVLNTKLFRPPHGRMRGAQKKALIEAGYEIFLWDLLTHDYNPKYSANDMLSVVRQYVRNGSIIVFHDSLKSKDRMLQVLPKAIEQLLKMGYSFDVLGEDTRENR